MFAAAQQPEMNASFVSSESPLSQQQGVTAQAPRQETPLRATTRLVQVNVVVNDKHGNPISGLTKKDFVLLDNKKLQDIQLFSADTNRPSGQIAAPLPPNSYTNRITGQLDIPSSVTMILLDALNTEVADQAHAREQVLKFLERLPPQENVALYWLGSDLRSLHDFTTDAAALREALRSFRGESSRRLAESGPEAPMPNAAPGGQTSSRQAFRLAFEQRAANESSVDRVRLTVAALIAIANHVDALKGRKNLVWVSGSFSISLGYEKFDLNWSNDTGSKFEGAIARAAQALTHANVAVYPVDARGLLGSDAGAAQDDLDSSGNPDQSEPHLPTQGVSGIIDTMKLLAERTGGRAFYNSNDIAGAISRAMDDSRASYTLGYSPVDVKWDGSFHTIKVMVTIPGAEVRARTGYFALPEPTAMPMKGIRSAISQTAISQLEATGIGMRVQVHASEVAGEHSLTTELHFDLHEIQVEQRGGQWVGTLQSVFLQLDKQGKILHADDQTFHLNLTPAMYERLQQEGMSETRRVQALPGAVELCVVLRDVENGNTGSITIPMAKYFPAEAETIK